MPKKIFLPQFELENGEVFERPVIAYHSWGTLNKAGDNAIVVCHSLTNNSDASSWWRGLIGSGCVLDSDRYFVICLNTIGSPYGSVSPLSINPATGNQYGGDFPDVTVRDTVRAHREALRILGVERVALVIGASMGGMQVLEWAFFDDFVDALVPIAVGGRHAPWGIAWTEAQRQAIFADPKWNDGHYSPDDPPTKGLAVARMIAMVSYRSAVEFEGRFGRELSTEGTPGFSVESYLRNHGQKLVSRFDPGCYVQLTRQMNSHDVSRGRGPYRDVLGTINQLTLVVGVNSDVLYPLAEQQELASLLPNGDLKVIDAPYGHDSFLVVSDELCRILKPFLELVAVVCARKTKRLESGLSATDVSTRMPFTQPLPLQRSITSN